MNKQALLGEFHINERFELFLQAWLGYHTAANEVDGHISYPQTKQDHYVCSLAVRAGKQAMLKHLGYTSYQNPEDKADWNQAKWDALRVLARQNK